MQRALFGYLGSPVGTPGGRVGLPCSRNESKLGVVRYCRESEAVSCVRGSASSALQYMYTEKEKVRRSQREKTRERQQNEIENERDTTDRIREN